MDIASQSSQSSLSTFDYNNHIAIFNRIVPEVLNNSNYLHWSFWVKSYLMFHELWNIVDGTEKQPENSQFDFHWRTKNMRALGAIYISCGPKILEKEGLLEKDTAKDLWNELANTFSTMPGEENGAGEDDGEDQDEVAVEPDGTGEGEGEDQDEIAEERDGAGEGEVAEERDGAGEGEGEDQDVQKNKMEQKKMVMMTDYKWLKPLVESLEKDDWAKSKDFFEQHPDSLKGSIEENGYSALMLLVTHKKLKLVNKLVKMYVVRKMLPEALEHKNVNADNVLHIAAEYGFADLAKIFVTNNANLVSHRNKRGEIPLLVAASWGQQATLHYLYKKTPKEELSGENGMAGASLLRSGMRMELYDIILDLLDYDPLLGVTKDKYGKTLMNELAICPHMTRSRNQSRWQQLIGALGKPFLQVFKLLSGTEQLQNSNLKHHKTLEILDICCKQISVEGSQVISNFYSTTLVDQLSYESICSGNLHFLKTIMKSSSHYHFQNVIDRRDSQVIKGVKMGLANILGHSIISREEKIFQLLSKMVLGKQLAYPCNAPNARDDICHDKFISNTYRNRIPEILQIAAMLPHLTELQRVSGAALQMQRELQWFKEVEKIVPSYTKARKLDGLTPKELFTTQHKELVEKGEKWMKETSQYCMVVATLISTVMFAAAFTLPGGNNDTGHPIFVNSPSFLLFIISDALSLFSSTSSVLIFLSILTARYAEDDFLFSLPRKLIIGLATLFFSIASMMVSFAVTIVIVLQGKAPWIVVPVTLFAIVPVTLFASLQFPLFAEMYSNTFGSGIFNNQFEIELVKSPFPLFAKINKKFFDGIYGNRSESSSSYDEMFSSRSSVVLV